MTETDQEYPVFDIPILFLIYNRPKHTRMVFERIRDARPARLFIAADGPKTNRGEDEERCRETRRVVESINWPCETNFLMRDSNLGCGEAVSSAITWFFKQVEEGIILEDDCLPDPSFFPYMKEILERYRNSSTVTLVSGYNPALTMPKMDSSYFISSHTSIWGWGTWRRAWSGYDRHLSPWNKEIEMAISENTSSLKIRRLWKYHYLHTRSGMIDTWDFQLQFRAWLEKKYAVLPAHSLVANIGVDGDGTNAMFGAKARNYSSQPMHFPLSHPMLDVPIPELEDALSATNDRPWYFIVALKYLHLVKRFGLYGFAKALLRWRKSARR